MGTRNKHNRSHKGGDKTPVDKKAAKPVAAKTQAKAKKSDSGATRTPAAMTRAAPAGGAAGTATKTGNRADFVNTGLNALRERLKQTPAPTKPGKKARREAPKIDARVEAALQRLGEHYRRMLD